MDRRTASRRQAVPWLVALVLAGVLGPAVQAQVASVAYLPVLQPRPLPSTWASPTTRPSASPTPTPDLSPTLAPSPKPGGGSYRWVADVGGRSSAVAVLGQTAYLGEGHRVVIVDISRPGLVRRAGRRGPLPGLVHDLIVADGHLFVAAGAAGLRVFDLTDELAPREVGALDTPGELRSLSVSGPRALLADGPGGLRVVDVADPAAPRELGALDTVQDATGVDVDGEVAYVSIADDRNGGLLTVDLSDPARPRELDVAPTEGEALGVRVTRGFAYLADGGGGLKVFDVADPRRLQLVEGASLTHGARGLSLVGDLAYVTGGLASIWVADLSRPGAPRVARTIDTPGSALDVAVDSDRLLVADDRRGLVLYDRRPDGWEWLAAKLDVQGFTAFNLAIEGRHAYVTTSTGLAVVDIADPEAPEPIGGLYDLEVVLGPTVLRADHAYLATVPHGLVVIDLSRPGSPVRVGSVAGLGSAVNQALDLALAGSTLYGIDRSIGIRGAVQLRAFDVTAPREPRPIGSLPLPFGMSLVDVAGDHVFVTGPGLELWALAAEAPGGLVRVGSLPPVAESVFDMAVAGGFAYLTSGQGVHVVDVRDSARMRDLGVVPLPFLARTIRVSAGMAYLAAEGEGAGVGIVDLSQPATPRFVALLDNPGRALDVAAEGDYLFVANFVGGLQIYQMTAEGSQVRGMTAR